MSKHWHNGAWHEVTCAWMDATFDFEKWKQAYRDGFRAWKALRADNLLKYEQRGDWIRRVLCFPRFCQIEAFDEVKHVFSDEMYWRLLGHICWASRNHAQYLDLYLKLLREPRPHHFCFHTPEQQRRWDSLPDRVMIFRGHGKHNQHGLYYGLGLRIACGVAVSHGSVGKVSSYIVPKTDLFYMGLLGDHGLGVPHECVAYVKGLGEIQRRLFADIVRGKA